MKMAPECSPELLTLYCYDELESDEKKTLEKHLQECASCQQELAELQAFSHDLKWPEELDRAAVQRIESGLDRSLQKRRYRFAWPGTAFAAGAAALLYLLLVQPAPAPRAVPSGTLMSQLEILQQLELLEDMEILEDLDLFTEIEDLG